MMRDYRIYDDHVTLYWLRPFKNHTRTHYRQHYAGSFYIRPEWVKRLIGWFWYHFGREK